MSNKSRLAIVSNCPECDGGNKGRHVRESCRKCSGRGFTLDLDVSLSLTDEEILAEMMKLFELSKTPELWATITVAECVGLARSCIELAGEIAKEGR